MTIADWTCPRCGSSDLESYSGVSAGCEWGQTRCDDCDHSWGDGLPDSQDRALPEGHVDCDACEGSGGYYGRTCRPCGGEGIVACESMAAQA